MDYIRLAGESELTLMCLFCYKIRLFDEGNIVFGHVFPDKLYKLAVKFIGIFGDEIFLFVLLRSRFVHRCG